MSDMIIPEPKDHFFSSDGVKIHYTEWGDPAADTVIFIHGIRDQGISWMFLLSSLAKLGCPIKHAVAIDLRGHGESEWVHKRGGYQHEDFLYDVAALIRHLNKTSVTLIGHSLGGSMALLYAGCFPEIVAKLVSLESVGPFAKNDRDVPELMAERLQGGRKAKPSIYKTLEDAAKAIKKRFPLIPDTVCAHMAEYGTKRISSGVTWKYDPSFRFRSTTMLSEGQIAAFIDRIQCPILLIHGTESDFMTSERSPRIKLFKDARLVAIQGAGHHIPHEKPDELAKVIAAFLFADP
jgi:pimeloyl-ACP methyl ester carboxylesterase